MASTDKAFLAKKVVSVDGPKPEEVQHNASLEEWCTTQIEPEEESNRRRSVLERIHNIVRVWIRHTMITEFRMPEAAAAQVEGRIFATGSYRYNVHTSGSDIDMVLIAPSRITRDHFFNALAARLKLEQWVTDLHCITETRVPIIAMVCDGIDIDLSFGSIRQDRVPEVITDDLLQGLDEQSVLSCNAVRVAHNIMDLVPNKSTFRQTLRFVKAWGKARLIYSNTFGFPSGIGWAILTAFVCQCYPKQNAAGMVARFFRTYHAWFKPNPHETGTENRAIYLTESMRAKTNLGRCWDPRESKSDAMALFPILTPALPYGNACYNVTLTNLRQLCSEFARGYEMVSSGFSSSPADAQADHGSYGVWSKLLEQAPFFGAYKHYMHIQVACTDSEHYQAYVDGVESRIRILWAGNASSRGHTLEDVKHLRLYLNPRRYEDPVMNRRVELSKNTAASRDRGGMSHRGSTTLDSASVRPSADMSAAPLLTSHYFIGMAVDTSVSTSPVDLVPSIRTFYSVVKQLKQYREGVTKLPSVRVLDINSIPAFVKEAVGFTDSKQLPSNAAGVQSIGSAHTGAGGTGSGSDLAEAGGAVHSPNSVSGTAQGGNATVVGSAAGATSVAQDASLKRIRYGDHGGKMKMAKAEVEDECNGLEQALGLDF